MQSVVLGKLGCVGTSLKLNQMHCAGETAASERGGILQSATVLVHAVMLATRCHSHVLNNGLSACWLTMSGTMQGKLAGRWDRVDEGAVITGTWEG